MRLRWRDREGLLGWAVLLFLAFAGVECARAKPVHIEDFPLGLSVSRTDYESIDPVARRLYIANMGGGQLVVFDIEHNALIAKRDGFPKVTGVLVVPELRKVFASVPGSGILPSLSVGLGMAGLSSGTGKIAILDAETLHELARPPGGVFPDGIAYDPRERRIFVSDELGSAIIVIDAVSNRKVGRIATGGEVGNVRYDPTSEKAYAPVQSHNELVSIDPDRLALTTRHATTGGEHPHGFIVAPGTTVGYVACDGNDRLLAVDLRTGDILANLPVAHDPDVLAIDEGLGRLYVASESGNLSIFDIGKATAPVPLGQVFVGDDAHAVAVDPVSHRLYFALADLDGRMVLRVLSP